ncbi:MAG: ABC transporter substrate-binding protein [Desulfobacteraceae bacterium]
MKFRIYIPVIFLLCLVLVACKESRTSQPQTMEKVRLQLKWQHQAQFAGFYMARERGYYEQENIQVTFIEGGKARPGGPVRESVA